MRDRCVRSINPGGVSPSGPYQPVTDAIVCMRTFAPRRTLSVNGKKVAGGRIEKTVPVYFSTDDTFDVGEDWGTPVSTAYQPPFPFTGTLKRVTVQAKSP